MGDCKTRWNSTLKMVQKFISMKKGLCYALNFCNVCVKFLEDDFLLCKMLVDALEPIERVVLVMCRNDISIYEAEKAAALCVKNFPNGSFYAKNLGETLKQRIDQRSSNIR